jgi:hypothetical protein
VCTRYNNFKYLYYCGELVYEKDEFYDFYLRLLLWWCNGVNEYCDSNRVSEDLATQSIFYDFISTADYFIADYELLSKINQQPEVQSSPKLSDIEKQVFEIRFKELQTFYQQAMNGIDGLTTGAERFFQGFRKKYHFSINSPVAKNKLKELFTNYFNDLEAETLIVGEPCEFEYTEFNSGTSEFVYLDGKPFRGFYKK